jgi:membrane protein YqaA with SNARE-associated domain
MADLSVIGAAALTCLAGGVLPWINAEVVVIGASMVLPTEALPLLVLACALAQTTSKSALYGLARWSPQRLPARAARLLGAAERHRDGRSLVALVLSGALLAVPPFYLVTLACGLVRVPFVSFALSGFIGTVTRYAFLAWIAFALAAP